MKNLLIVPFLMLFINVMAQTKPVKIVFDVTSNSEETHQSTLRHVTMMAEAYPGSEFEVVIYGGALPMVLKNDSSVSKEILSFKDHENVSFKVCEGTMKRYQVDKTQLLSGVETVEDGILEIVTKQSEGWGYIKETGN